MSMQDDWTFPTRLETITLVQILIDGKITAQEVSQWASEINFPEHNRLYEEVEKNDPFLIELLDGLAIADERHPDGTKMYDTASYQEWLDEYLSSSNK